MKLKSTKCSNTLCKQTFKVWEKEPKDEHFCSEMCFIKVNGTKSFWGKEDRRATALKEERTKDGK